MTTDDKTDSKSETNGRSESSTTTQTGAATDGQRVDTKIPVIQSGSGSDDTNCAQIQSIDECLN
ncbi:unnamed protein product, partial [Oppiella nova]